MQNYVYKIRYKYKYLFKPKKEITTNEWLKDWRLLVSSEISFLGDLLDVFSQELYPPTNQSHSTHRALQVRNLELPQKQHLDWSVCGLPPKFPSVCSIYSY